MKRSEASVEDSDTNLKDVQSVDIAADVSVEISPATCQDSTEQESPQDREEHGSGLNKLAPPDEAVELDEVEIKSHQELNQEKSLSSNTEDEMDKILSTVLVNLSCAKQVVVDLDELILINRECKGLDSSLTNQEGVELPGSRLNLDFAKPLSGIEMDYELDESFHTNEVDEVSNKPPLVQQKIEIDRSLSKNQLDPEVVGAASPLQIDPVFDELTDEREEGDNPLPTYEMNNEVEDFENSSNSDQMDVFVDIDVVDAVEMQSLVDELLLVDVSNDNKKLALHRLSTHLRENSVLSITDSLKTLQKFLIVQVKESRGTIRALILKVLTGMMKNRSLEDSFQNYAPGLIHGVLQSFADEDNWAVYCAGECGAAMVAILQPDTLLPELILCMSERFPISRGATEILTKFVRVKTKEEVEELLDTIMPPALNAYQNDNIKLRRAVMFLVSALYDIVGADLMPYLRELESWKRELLIGFSTFSNPPPAHDLVRL